jgi:hypothetical protein
LNIKPEHMCFGLVNEFLQPLIESFNSHEGNSPTKD